VHAVQALRTIVPACVEGETGFKVAGDPALLDVLDSKLQARGHSGKFMTIYPQGEDAFKDLMEDLYQRTRDTAMEGPYILSDRRYRDSRVLFYRYGGFRPLHRLNIDGTKSMLLVPPEGERVLSPTAGAPGSASGT
jgi:hypothetical protein